MAKHDITGERFGKQTAIRFIDAKNNNERWLVRCDCGSERIVHINHVRYGGGSCGCDVSERRRANANYENIAGQRFGRLVAVERLRVEGRRYARWKLKCDCGGEAITTLTRLKSDHTNSCGCLQREAGYANRIHGQSKGVNRRATRLYDIWGNMKARCNRADSTGYQRYGGRGIRVCAEWNDFEAFEEWAMANGYSLDLSIDRIDNDGNYEPGNCRWATPAQQIRNSTKARIHEINGAKACIKDHAAAAGVSYHGVRYHLSQGRSIADAIERVRNNQSRWRRHTERNTPCSALKLSQPRSTTNLWRWRNQSSEPMWIGP